MKKPLLVIFAAISLAGCANLYVVTPNPRVETPETSGMSSKWSLSAVTSGAHLYTSTENAGARPPDLSKGTVDVGQEFSPGFSFSRSQNLDFGVELDLLGGGLSLSTKYQLTGQASDEAKMGSKPIALFGRVGRVAGHNSGDQSVTFGAGGFPWDGQIATNFIQAGLSGGSRVFDYLLIYGGIAAGKYWASTEIHQDSNSSGSSPGGSYKKLSVGDGLTAALGVSLGLKNFQLFTAVEYSHIDYNDGEPTDMVRLQVGSAK